MRLNKEVFASTHSDTAEPPDGNRAANIDNETNYTTLDDSPQRKRTARGFDPLLLTRIIAFTPDRIRTLRAREGISQAVLALHLNVPRKLVSDWERGLKQPSGPTLKLLSLGWQKGVAHIA